LGYWEIIMRSFASAAFVFVVAAGAAAATFFLTAQPVAAQDDPPRIITVSGTGEATARPDQATVNLGVLSEADTAREALSANNAAMQAVFDQLAEIGIPEENIQTSNFSISPQYPPYRQGSNEPRRIIGYQVSNMVSVRFDDLDDLGPGLDAIVSSGANQLYGISFSIAETDALMTNARVDAVEDARAKADTLAEAAGVRIVRVLSISEGGASYPQPVMYARAEMAMDSSVPVAAGEQTLRVSVSMTFEIE
jgi:uncharacterized protein YggE